MSVRIYGGGSYKSIDSFQFIVAVASQRAAQQGSGAELLKLRFLRMVLPAKAKIQVVCSAGPQSPHFGRWAAKVIVAL